MKGLPVLDADVYAREALAPGSPATLAVLARYGERVRQAPAAAAAGAASGDPAAAGLPVDATADRIDRAALGRIVFAEPRERHWLEQLLHPQVRQRFDMELRRLKAEPAVVLVIPLLFEAGLEGLCREVWLVDCDEEQQRQRLMARDGLSEIEARERLATQWPVARKRPLADLLIDNRGAIRPGPGDGGGLAQTAWRWRRRAGAGGGDRSGAVSRSGGSAGARGARRGSADGPPGWASDGLPAAGSPNPAIAPVEGQRSGASALAGGRGVPWPDNSVVARSAGQQRPGQGLQFSPELINQPADRQPVLSPRCFESIRRVDMPSQTLSISDP